MAERTLRGARLGGQSFEDERGIEFAARQQVGYRCPQGHAFESHRCRSRPTSRRCGSAACGAEALRVDGIERPEAKAEKPARTHWDMLLERRSDRRSSRTSSRSASTCCAAAQIGPRAPAPATPEAPRPPGGDRRRRPIASSGSITSPGDRPGPPARSGAVAGAAAAIRRHLAADESTRPGPGRGPTTAPRRPQPAGRPPGERPRSRPEHGGSRSRPRRRVTNPGTSSSVPPTRISAAVGELAGRHAGRCERRARSACQARAPSCLISQAPRTLSSDEQQDRPPGADHLADLDQRRRSRPAARPANSDEPGPARRTPSRRRLAPARAPRVPPSPRRGAHAAARRRSRTPQPGDPRAATRATIAPAHLASRRAPARRT